MCVETPCHQSSIGSTCKQSVALVRCGTISQPLFRDVEFTCECHWEFAFIRQYGSGIRQSLIENGIDPQIQTLCPRAPNVHLQVQPIISGDMYSVFNFE